MMDFLNETVSQTHLEFRQPIIITFALLSFLGAIAIMISYYMCPEERNTVRQLLLLLTVADCIIASTHLISLALVDDLMSEDNLVPNAMVVSNQTICDRPIYGCIARSFVGSTAYLVSYFYTVTIATYFYIVGVRGVHEGVHKRLIWVHIFCWVVPLLINIAALSCGALGLAIRLSRLPSCSIDSCHLTATQQIVWMTLDGHGWLIAAYIVCPILYFFLWRDIRQQRARLRRPFATINERMGYDKIMLFRKEDVNFMYTPVMLYLLRVWGTIRYIMAIVELQQGAPLHIPYTLDHFLIAMMYIGNNAQGFGNFILFCVFDATIVSKTLLRLCWRKPKEQLIEIVRPSTSSAPI